MKMIQLVIWISLSVRSALSVFITCSHFFVHYFLTLSLSGIASEPLEVYQNRPLVHICTSLNTRTSMQFFFLQNILPVLVHLRSVFKNPWYEHSRLLALYFEIHPFFNCSFVRFPWLLYWDSCCVLLSDLKLIFFFFFFPNYFFTISSESFLHSPKRCSLTYLH